jgi:DNA-binding FadR family transcriptional regulator
MEGTRSTARGRQVAAWTSSSSSSSSTQAKLATGVADRIVSEIVDQGWPVGAVLGSEPELLERYGVSRAVFREAVRLVEHQQVVTTRRGPGGGLVVTAPTIEGVADATQLTLFRLGASLDEVAEARIVLERLGVELAASRLRELDEQALAELIQGEEDGQVRDHHSILAAATGNPALELFVELLSKITGLFLVDRTLVTSRIVDEVRRAHARIVESVCQGDGERAANRMETHLRAEADLLRSQGLVRPRIDPALSIELSSGGKRADELARELLRGIVWEGLVPGELIGSEAELMDRFGVSRAILREAVQLLEHYDLAAMRRGPGGGLIVLEPRLSAVTDVIALYLEYHGISSADVFELRVGVEMAIVDRFVEVGSADAGAMLLAALDAEAEAADEDFKETATDLHLVLASCCGNRALQLVAVVLISLSRLHEGSRMPNLARSTSGAEVTRAHQALVEALLCGDRDVARRRMRRHLEELSRFYD